MGDISVSVPLALDALPIGISRRITPGISPSGFITSFTSQFKGAQSASAGTLGGRAACVNAQNSTNGTVALCTWADGDTFGVVASQTMGTSQLATQMLVIRPGVERSAR